MLQVLRVALQFLGGAVEFFVESIHLEDRAVCRYPALPLAVGEAPGTG